MQRADLSSNLVHLTKVDCKKWDESNPADKAGMENEAFFIFLKILRDKKLISNNKMIKGKHKCVCFSETPLPVLQQLFSNKNHIVKYRPFGIVYNKETIYRMGGLPVIYQPEEDYCKLPPNKAHLHMTFDLRKEPPTDFTWEREWRYRSDDGIVLESTKAKVLVPNENIRSLVGRYLSEATSAAHDPWDYIILDQHGIDVPVQQISLPAMQT